MSNSLDSSIQKIINCLDIDHSSEELESIQSEYVNHIPKLDNFEIIKGKIVTVTKKHVLVDIGYKSDGVISIKDFRDDEGIVPGSYIDVYVDSKDDISGRIILSRKKAKLVLAWRQINDGLENKTAIESLVKYPTKGGLIVDISGLECFLPITQIDYRPVTDLESYVGKAIDVIPLKINKQNNNIVVSHKAIIEQGVENQKTSILESLERGAIVEGIVKSIADYGAFVDIGGTDGLVHITDIAWRRIKHPTDVLDLGQRVNVVILDFNEEAKKVSLGIKQLTVHPWDMLPEDFGVGTKVTAKVVCITGYGIFLEVLPGIEGLIHAGEMSWAYPPESPAKLFKIGDSVDAVVINLDKENKQLALSIKKLSVDPWKNDQLTEKYQVGAKYLGKVKNITKFGAFVELEPGIDGLLHISDLSWCTKVDNPSEIVKTGDTIDVKILSIDKDNKKLSLGIKQLQENPCEAYKDFIQPGCIVKGFITKLTKLSKGAVIKLDYGMEAFCRKESLIKKSGVELKIGEPAEFRILAFDPQTNNIVVSHTGVDDESEVTNFKAYKKFDKDSSANNKISDSTSNDENLS